MARRPATKNDVYYVDGGIIKLEGLAKLLGCSKPSAQKIAAEAVGFPPKRVLARGIEGWCRPEIEAWLLNPTAPPVDEAV